MARASTPRGDVARERILQHALLIFAHRGFDGFTTRELSAKAKVNIAAINYHFGHKHGLYEAALADAARRIRARGEHVFAAEVAPLLVERGAHPEASLDRARLRLVARRFYEGARQEAAAVRLLLRQVLDAGHLALERGAGAQALLPSTETAAGVLAAVLRVPLPQARLNTTMFNFLITRFLVEDEQSLKEALGVEDAEAQIVESLLGALSMGAN